MDFLIEFYSDFLLMYNIPYAQGLVLWYVAEFCLYMFIIIFVLFLFVLTKNFILLRFCTVNNNEAAANKKSLYNNDLKIIFQKQIVDKKTDKFFRLFSYLCTFVPALILWFILPLSTGFCVIKSEASVFLYFAVLLIYFFGITLSVFMFNDKFDAERVLSSFFFNISYIIPFFISVISVVILSGSLSLLQIIVCQYEKGFLTWYCIPAIAGFFICLVSAFVQSRNIFEAFSDSCEPETCSCQNKYILLPVQCTFLIAVCAFIATIFLGGYLPPVQFCIAGLFDFSDILYGIVLNIEQIFLLFLKTFIIIALFIYADFILKNKKYNFTREFSWKFLIPLSFLNLLLVCVIKLITIFC